VEGPYVESRKPREKDDYLARTKDERENRAPLAMLRRKGDEENAHSPNYNDQERIILEKAERTISAFCTLLLFSPERRAKPEWPARATIGFSASL